MLGVITTIGGILNHATCIIPRKFIHDSEHTTPITVPVAARKPIHDIMLLMCSVRYAIQGARVLDKAFAKYTIKERIGVGFIRGGNRAKLYPSCSKN
jgi:hypothetical protein